MIESPAIYTVKANIVISDDTKIDDDNGELVNDVFKAIKRVIKKWEKNERLSCKVDIEVYDKRWFES